MTTPSARELEAEFSPTRPRDLSLDVLARIRERSKRMFGNQDRLEVAVAISRVALAEVNATDLGEDVKLEVNRIRAQLLTLEALGLLAKTGDGHAGRRMFQCVDPHHPFWAFAVNEYEGQLDLE